MLYLYAFENSAKSKIQIARFIILRRTLNQMLPRLQIVYWGGEEFYLYLWLFSMFMLIFLMTVYPDYIAPLFDKYTPMPEGELLK
jgi:hypothetical protein